MSNSTDSVAAEKSFVPVTDGVGGPVIGQVYHVTRQADGRVQATFQYHDKLDVEKDASRSIITLVPVAPPDLPTVPPAATLAYVRWFDSAMTFDRVTLDDLDGLGELESAGIIVKEDDESITLALDHSVKFGWLRMTMCIPKVCVRSVTKFEVPAILDE